MVKDLSLHQGLTRLGPLYEQARVSDPVYAQVMDDFVEKLRVLDPEKFGNLVFVHGPLKIWDEAVLNVHQKFNGDAGSITDLVRGTLLIDAEHMDDLMVLMGAHLDCVGAVKDRVARPNDFGFRDKLTHIRLPNGHICEVQCHIQEIHALRDFTKDLRKEAKAIEWQAMEEQRFMLPSEVLDHKRLTKTCLGAHNKVAIAGGLNEQLDPDLSEGRRVLLVIPAFPVVDFALVSGRGPNPEPVPVIRLDSEDYFLQPEPEEA